MKPALTVLTAAILFVACNSAKKEDKGDAEMMKKDPNPTLGPVLTVDMVVNQTDPVCNMSLKERLGDTVHYMGKVYGVCSKECKAEFVKNPSAYVKN